MGPVTCQKCERVCKGKFVDGRHPGLGQWGYWCTSCFRSFGGKFGTGLGQLYDAVTGKKLKG
jgi:hypothetical protein